MGAVRPVSKSVGFGVRAASICVGGTVPGVSRCGSHGCVGDTSSSSCNPIRYARESTLFAPACLEYNSVSVKVGGEGPNLSRS